MKTYYWFGLIVVGSVLGYFTWNWYKTRIDPRGGNKQSKSLNLEKYDFDSLRQAYKEGQFGKGELQILGNLPIVEKLKGKEKDGFVTKEISFESDGKKISGMMNYHPEKSSLSPVVIMIRGFAESEGYFIGSGSWKVANELARQSADKLGYATISLDFLGYGNSDKESSDVLEARFQKVTQVIDLIETVKKIPWVDKQRIAIWAHSNGGQIALSVLEVTKENYPTILWAPMTQPFPESVLSTNEADSPINGIIADFQKYYDARRYAFENYYDWIKAPVLIQQGTNDQWCKVEWQEIVVEGINKYNKLAQLVIYEGADHNLKGSWDEAVKKDLDFLGKSLKMVQ